MTDGVVFFVEGDADKRFLENIITPNLEKDHVNIFCYSQEPDDKVNDLVSVFDEMYREPCFLRDYDYGKQDCYSVSDRKDFVSKKFPEVDPECMIIVKDAIEGWYLAGLSDSAASDLNIDVPQNTEDVGKAEFNQKLDNSKYTSAINFQKEIISEYSVSIAKRRNASFDYLIDDLGI